MDETGGVELVASFALIMGRKIQTQQLTDAQLALLARESTRLNRDPTNEQAIQSVTRVLNILEQAIANQEDRDWLVDEMVSGNVNLEDLAPLYTSVERVEQTKPTVRRAPRRSV